jgi:hypothetical protein
MEHMINLGEYEKQDKQQKIMTDDIQVLAKDLHAIYLQAEIYYTSAVDDVIRRQSKDTKEIEHILN